MCSSTFNGYGNTQDWQMCHNVTIHPDPEKFNKDGRREIRILMVIDEVVRGTSRLSSEGRNNLGGINLLIMYN
jgi:hypothetical protein